MVLSAHDIPDGFEPIEAFGPFHELTGPYFAKQRGDRFVIGLRVDAKHRNAAENLHGGMFFMLLDTAMTYTSVRAHPPGFGAVTTSFSSEIYAAARPGDWVEAEVEIRRAGRRVIFLDAVVRCGDRMIGGGSACFTVVERPE